MRLVLRALFCALPILAPAAARAAVAFDAQGTADCTANSATSITCSTLTIGSGSNRALVVLLNFSNTAVSGLSVTWDSGGTNQAPTLIGAANTSGQPFGRAALYGLVAPTSGNKTLSVSWSGASDVYVDAASFTGVNQAGGGTSFPGFASATGNPGGSGTASVTITSASGDMVVATGTGAADVTATGQTQMFLDTNATNINGWGNRAAGASSVAMTATIGAGGGYWVQIGTDVAAAPAGGGCAAHHLSVLGAGC